MSKTVVGINAARQILQAGGIRTSDDELHRIAAELDRIARLLITSKYLNKSATRRRPRRMLTLRERKTLFWNLLGVWDELPGVSKLPGVTYSAYTGETTGKYVWFVQEFCRVVADSVQQEIGDRPESVWRGLIRNLRAIERDGSRVRDGLRLLKPTLKRIESLFRT